MPGFQVCPFFFGKVGADNCFSINNCLQWHNDPMYLVSIKSCPGIFTKFSKKFTAGKNPVPNPPQPPQNLLFSYPETSKYGHVMAPAPQKSQKKAQIELRFISDHPLSGAFLLDILHEEGVRKRSEKFTSMSDERILRPGPQNRCSFPFDRATPPAPLTFASH
jgi:hypothetical protein